MTKVPYSEEAERSVLGRVMAAGPKVAGEVIGTMLVPEHFYSPAHAVIFSTLVENYYADDPVDALSIGERASKRLAHIWSCEEDAAILRVRDMAIAQTTFSGSPVDHAQVVKQHADLRSLLELATTVQQSVAKEEMPAEEIASLLSHEAMLIATSRLLTHDLVSFGDLGRRFLRESQRLAEARRQGQELGAYFGLRFLDAHLRGLQPTEVWMLAGEPGAGKSAVAYVAALRFAQRQMRKARDLRIGTLVLSLEMGEAPSNVRLAQTVARVDGGRLREATFTPEDFRRVQVEWGRRKELPLWFNFSSLLRVSQVRALVVEAIRRHNVGLVVIDHMRYLLPDRAKGSQNENDEDVAIFLKESLAKELNVAVVCLAHTTKGIENTPDHRPNLTHLRGSGQVSAHADFVSFVYRPHWYASQEDREKRIVAPTEAEMIWRKSRHSEDGIARFYFNPEVMKVEDD